LFLATASRRSLIVAPSTVTESVLAQPLLALLRRFDAFGRLDVLAHATVAPLFRAMSEPDEVIETDIGLNRIALLRRLALSRRIEAASYDCAYILQEGRMAAMAAWLARIPRRIVPAGARGSRFGRLPAAGARERAIGDRFVAMAFPPTESLPTGIPAPQLASPPAMTEALARRLNLDPGTPLILLCPSSELGPGSEWPVRHYAALAALIALQWPALVVGLIGQPRDRAVATQVALLSGEALQNWCGQLDLAETLALMSHAAAVVTSESQYMHLAAALGRPQVAIYGAGNPRAERIATNRRSVMWLNLECSPCLEAHCRFGHMACVALQTPSQVFASLRKAMRFSATA
jgi:heptosyltransferase-2